MNKSEKDILPLRVGVNGKAAGTLLAGLAMGGPIGLTIAALGVAMGWGGNSWLNAETKRMEQERAEGKTPTLPDAP